NMFTLFRELRSTAPAFRASVCLPEQARETLIPKRKAKPDPRYAEQPAVAVVLKLLRHPRGATVAEIAKKRGLQPHTVRSVLSRLSSKAGLVLTRTKVKGRAGTVYRAHATWAVTIIWQIRIPAVAALPRRKGAGSRRSSWASPGASPRVPMD